MKNATVAPTRVDKSRRGSRRRPSARSGRRARARIEYAETGPLGRYLRENGRAREIVALEGRARTLLVIDRDALTLGDRRLVAHIGADEPPDNAALVCEIYLDDRRGRWCRPVWREDLEAELPEPDSVAEISGGSGEARELTDDKERVYRIGVHRERSGAAQLRWLCIDGAGSAVLSVRQVVGNLESYEPARAFTLEAIQTAGRDRAVSVATLRAELARLDASPIVLNRGLREAVLRALESEGLSMSEIAQRCGRVKRDSRGNQSGEASWLGRRIGMLPEAGMDRPTSWVHSEVLGLIARCGLSLSPREVEL